MARIERLALQPVQRLGQQPVVGDEQHGADQGQEPEDAVPVRMDEQEATDHRRDRRRNAEIDRHLRHHALRVGRREHVADHRSRDDDAGAGRHALQCTEEDQRADMLGQRAAGRRQREHRDAGQHHRTAAETVGQRAVEQVHDREAEQIGRQGLLHLDRGRADRSCDAGERRQIGVDRERAEHAEAGEQQRQCPAGCAPQRRGIGIHRFGSGWPRRKSIAVAVARHRAVDADAKEKCEASR